MLFAFLRTSKCGPFCDLDSYHADLQSTQLTEAVDPCAGHEVRRVRYRYSPSYRVRGDIRRRPSQIETRRNVLEYSMLPGAQPLYYGV